MVKDLGLRNHSVYGSGFGVWVQGISALEDPFFHLHGKDHVALKGFESNLNQNCRIKAIYHLCMS